MKQLIHLDTVDKYNKLYGLETLHPLVSIVNLTKSTNTVNNAKMNYGLYAIYLKNGKQCDIKYGRQNYDYQQGTIVCFAPGQVAEISNVGTEVKPEVYGIIFHPDIIRGTALGQNMSSYGFFSYSVNEALHLSQKERQVFMDCLEKIQAELEHAIDKHSKQLIVTTIELLLSYCMRFYERQFITRSLPNKDILTKFEALVNDYFKSGLAQKMGLPSVKYFADKVYLSPNYFGDLIKKETGKSPQEYIQVKLIDFAKDIILSSNITMSEIAYQLGFQYPQHFGRLFKKEVGFTPKEYRNSIN